LDSPADLRAALTAELAAPELNSDRIAELAAALVGSDETKARFSVDAGLLARLGQQLVARHETALSELVKNSYDADATRVAVRIAGLAHGNYIEIADDGSGMTQEALVQGFMRLATNDKVENPTSPKFGRRRAGRKGVGRFAAERLGRRLILTTTTEDADSALRLEIDWDRFAAGQELGAISVPITLVRKPRSHGTVLRIERLRDNWPPATIQRTFEHVADLIDLGDQTKSGAKAGSEFSVTFAADGTAHEVVDVRSEVASQAFGIIEANIDGDGRVTWGLTSARLGIQFRDRPIKVADPDQPLLTFARHASLRAYYYILQSDYFAPTRLRTVQNYLAANGGIRLYRNGFRVPPYGQAGDDWLGLDLVSSGRSRTLAPIRNRNFLGTVSIDDDIGLFEETSSREGLIGSPAFDELVVAMRSPLLTGVRDMDAARTKLGLKRDRPISVRDIDRTEADSVARELNEAIRAAQMQIAREVTVSPAVSAALERVASSANKVARRASDALLKEIDLLRVLASMGLAIGQFTHEFSTLSGAMRASLAVLLEKGRSDQERTEAASAIRALLDQARDFTGLFRSMTEENALRERQSLDVYQAATSFRTAMQTVLDRNGVVMEILDDGDEVSSPPMHRSELFAILLNFTTNSIKAIKRAGRAGRILVRLRDGPRGGAVIEFADNGDGIAAEVAQTLFDPFVTTTAVVGTATSEEDLAVGSGLGLAIVRDIVLSAGGTVRVGPGLPTYETCMLVELPSSGESS
jgi:signal transduction histidine kinase